MDLGLTGKRAVVLASTRGIGFACARMLAAEGCEVVLNGRSKASVVEARERVLAEIPEARISGVPVDLSDAFEVAGLAERIAGGGLRRDILVNNTNGPPVQRVADTRIADWQAAVAEMLFPVFELTRAALGPMSARGWGRIISIVSSGVQQPILDLGISIRYARVLWPGRRRSRTRWRPTASPRTVSFRGGSAPIGWLRSTGRGPNA